MTTTRTLNRITREQTAFHDFADLVKARGKYRPTIELSNWDRRRLAESYDRHQELFGDERRAYTYMNAAMAAAEREDDHELALKLNENPYRPNDSIEVYSNQAMRDGWVLAVIGDEILIEYEMPAGTTAMLKFTVLGGKLRHMRNVSYRDCPKKWLAAIREAGMEWVGMGQRGNWPFPKEEK